jgi:hypothetical protein
MLRTHRILASTLSLIALVLHPACHTSSPRSTGNAADESSGDEDADEEESVEIGSVPEAVRAGARTYFHDLSACKASRESENGAPVFEIVGKGEGGRDVSLNVTSGGSVFEVEREIASDGLPPEVRATIAREFGDAAVKKAEAIEVHYYELHLVKDGKRVEARISATGEVMPVER